MRICVEGRRPISGIYKPSGNPNAAQALLAAALLTDAPVTLRNVPDTSSTRAMIDTARRLGATIEAAEDGAAPAETVVIQSSQLTRRVLTQSETDISTGAILFVPPLLIRRQHVRLELDFPLNRIRTHLEALRDLGVDVVTSSGAVEFKAATWDKGQVILTQASVTATAMAMMLASRLGRETVIYNAACEPHVQALAHTLAQMGAHVEGIGSNRLCVYGTSELKGADITIAPDHIEAASVAAIGALCGGRVQIEGVGRDDLGIIDKIYKRMGIEMDFDDTTWFIAKQDMLYLSNREEDVDSSIETAPWPGFPSDLVAVATVIATQARGTSLIHEKLFNNRLLFVDKLKAMGAQVVLCDPHRAIVVGHTPLHSIYIDSPDVRAGLGLLAAALAADGQSIIDNAQVIENSFANIFDKLRTMNAGIEVEG
jgi:UDP-N-acetylglucosamine 1-carboxyvinyltransferase